LLDSLLQEMNWSNARQLICLRHQLTSCLLKQPTHTPLVQCQRGLDANRAAVARIKRPVYTRQYPTTLVRPDGSTITVKYPEPRLLLRLPLDQETATPEQKRQITLIRRPKKTLTIDEDSGATFDPMKYIKK